MGGNNNGVVVGTYDYVKSENFMQGKDRLKLDDDIIGAMTTKGNDKGVVEQTLKTNLHIRKLTSKECIKLMGFESKDYRSMVEVGLSDSAIYHCAGDSICVNVLIGLFSSLLKKDSTKEINNYIERVVKDESN